MDINYESQYLDVKKNLYNIKYKPLVETFEGSLFSGSEGKFSRVKQDIKPEDLMSNTILFFKDRDMIKEDVVNICCYLALKASKKETPSDFPLGDLTTRVNMTLYKYVEVPSLLDNLVEFLVTNVIRTLRLFVGNFLKVYQETGQLEGGLVFGDVIWGLKKRFKGLIERVHLFFVK